MRVKEVMSVLWKAVADGGFLHLPKMAFYLRSSERESERVSEHMLPSAPSFPKYQQWQGLKGGEVNGNSIQDSNRGDGNAINWPSPVALQGLHGQEPGAKA